VSQPESLFLPATPRGWVIALCKAVIGPLLRVYYRVKQVRVDGIKAGSTQGKRIVFVANHIDRRDAALAFYFSKVLRDRFYYMSNREQLHEGTLYTWILRSCGVYSIARGLVDVSSIKYTLKLLSQESPSRLFLFPEGGAFSRNDAVFPFLTQPFELILKAQKKLEAADSIKVVPIAIRYEYENVKVAIDKATSRLEAGVGIDSPRGDAAHRLLAVGAKVVESFDRVFDIELPAYETEVHEKGLRIKQHLVDSLRSQLALIGGEEPRRVEGPAEGIEAARDVLNQLYARHAAVRADENLLPKNRYERRLRAQIFERMSRVYEEAKRLENWVGLDRDYFKDQVTDARLIDAIIRLEREVFGEVLWDAERIAAIKLGEPIDTASYTSADTLAADCRAAIMAMLR
jgi:1-acyl-sn-glycerol-3-phosphate acyltransferase